ncbi:MAG: histidine triad nucleotide-binding protein [bacterium]|nr:histidine triad nucleotide-binding protein [bacterium]
MENCVFCKIVNGEIPTDFIYQDDEVAAFKDINPKAPVHILIIPKKHISSLNEIEDEDQMLMGNLFLTARRVAYDQKVADTGYRVSINNGKDAGQEVKHLHMHLIAGRQLILG